MAAAEWTLMKYKTTAGDVPAVAAGDVFNGYVSFAYQLASGELLTGTPTITEETSSDLTLSDKAVSSGALVINGESVITAEAVSFKVLGQLQATGSYTVKIAATTTSSPAQTLTRYVRFVVTD